MGFIVFLAAALILAAGVLPWFGQEGSRGERLALVTLLGLGLITGVTWVLAMFGWLTRTALWASTGLFIVTGGTLLWRARRGSGPPVLRCPEHPLFRLGILGLVLAALFIAARGALIPVLEFDALSYHLPKAVEVMRAHGIVFIPSGDFRIPYFPWDYELLLADGLLLTRGDHQSYAIGLVACFGFGCYAYAMLRRAWPAINSTEALLGVIFVVACPVVVLHAGANKNDLLFAFFLVSAIHWMTLWSEERGRKPFLLAVASLGLGFGTKSTGLFLLPVVAVLGWRYHAKWRPQITVTLGRAVLWGAGLALLMLLTGSAWPLFNKVWCGHFLGETAMVGGVSGFQSNAVPTYTGFSNLWRFPLLAILRPFSRNPMGVWLFWRHEYWYWPAYNCMYSHFGWLCSVALLLLPVGFRMHRASLDGGAGYRSTLTWMSLAFVALSLPQAYRVDGMFCTFPRYVLVIPGLVALWGVVPALFWLREKGRTVLAWAAGLGLIAYFLSQAFLCFVNDTAKPLWMAEQCLSRPGSRPDMGVEDALNQVAGPGDTVAFDSGYGAFVYPSYGMALTRPLVFLPRGPGKIPLPAGVKWVVIDRRWNVGWSHPGARTTADFFLPIRRGESREDMALFVQMSRDPDYALVYSDPQSDQWIFVARRFLAGAKS